MESKKFKLNIKKKTLLIVDWANVLGWSKTLKWEVCPQRLFGFFDRPKIIDKRFYYGVEIGNNRSEIFGSEIEAIGFNFIKKEVKMVPVYLNKLTHFKQLVQKLFNVLDGIKVTNSDIATKLYELREKIENRLSEEDPDFNMGKDGEPHVTSTSPSYAKEDGVIYNETYDLIDNLDRELKKLNINIEELQWHLFEPVKRRKCDFDVEITRDALNAQDSYDTLLLFSGDGDYSALTEDLIQKGKKVILVFASDHLGKEYLKIKSNLFYACPVDNLENSIKKINPRI
jgi:uncharacterized LabA/DUF88 family protein